MSVKSYLITPISPTVRFIEWLPNSLTLSSIFKKQSKKDLVYQEENKTIISFINSNIPIIECGSIINEEEKFNILYLQQFGA